MRTSSSEKAVGPKKDDEGDQKKSPKITTPSSSSRQWTSSFKNPRIVRVSRGFGGKDRHSKVCTARGLRDRRIRLSVPTAIQLYDLQDRLGLSQPSKVIDWLIDATKHEIDKLPPLPMLPTNFLQYFHQPSSVLANDNILNTPDQPSPYVSDHHLLSPNLYKGRERWNNHIGSSQNDDGEGNFGGFVGQLSAHNFFPLNGQFSVPDLPYNFQLDTNPNLSLSQFGGGFSFSDRTDHQHSNFSLSSPSSHASSSQIYMFPSSTSVTPHFPPYIAGPSTENDQFRQFNHLQNVPTTHHLVNSPLKSLSFNASLQSNENEAGKQNGDRSS